jgi:hypothetical protein
MRPQEDDRTHSTLDMAQMAERPSMTEANGCMGMAQVRWMIIFHQGVP